MIRIILNQPCGEDIILGTEHTTPTKLHITIQQLNIFVIFTIKIIDKIARLRSKIKMTDKKSNV